jgi:hypothetical protein
MSTSTTTTSTNKCWTIILLFIMIILISFGIEAGVRLTAYILDDTIQDNNNAPTPSSTIEKLGIRIDDDTQINKEDEQERLRIRLVEFMTKHNPTKIDTVDEALKKWNYDEAIINTKLKAKYGVDLNEPTTTRTTQHKPTSTVKKSVPVVTVSSKASDEDNPPPTKSTPPVSLPFVEDDSPAILNAFGKLLQVKSTFSSTNNNKLLTTQSQESTNEFVETIINTPIQAIIIGLPQTGTDIISTYFEQVLKLKSCTETQSFERLSHVFKPLSHWDEEDDFILQQPSSFSNHGDDDIPNFEVFNDVQVIYGFASSVLYQEIVATYEDALVIVAVREIDSWWMDMKKHLQEELLPELKAHNCHSTAVKSCHDQQLLIKKQVYESLFGSISTTTTTTTTSNSLLTSEFLFKKAYYQFYESVLRNIPRGKRILFSVYTNADSSTQYGHRDKKWSLIGDLFSVSKTTVVSSWKHPSHMTEDILTSRKLGSVDLYSKFHIPTWLMMRDKLPTMINQPLNAATSTPPPPILLMFNFPQSGEEIILKLIQEKMNIINIVSSDWAKYFDKSFTCTSTNNNGCEFAMVMKQLLNGEASSPALNGFDKILTSLVNNNNHKDNLLLLLGGFPITIFMDEMISTIMARKSTPTYNDASYHVIVPVRSRWWKNIIKCSTTTNNKLKTNPLLSSSLKYLIGGNIPSPYVLKHKFQTFLSTLTTKFNLGTTTSASEILFIDLDNITESWPKLCEFLLSMLDERNNIFSNWKRRNMRICQEEISHSYTMTGIDGHNQC